MNSSGIKRGLAVSAISALAVAGMPALAGTANAVPLANGVAQVDDIVFVSPEDTDTISNKNDGQNTTVSLVVSGGSSVNAVSFQYSTDAGVTFVDVPGGPVARDENGVFKLDWNPGDLAVNRLRAIANTASVANPGGTQTIVVVKDNTANTVELSTEGALGVFQSPYTADVPDPALTEPTGDYVIADGTSSAPKATVPTVETRSLPAVTGSGTIVDDADDKDATPQTFVSILNIDGYNYSMGAEPNQLLIGAETATEDAEASTLYFQQISSITATPATQDKQGTAPAPVVLTVLDQRGNPVANAEVGRFVDNTAPAADVSTVIGYTNAKGQFTVADAGAGSSTFYVNTTDVNDFEPGTDFSATVTVNQYNPVVSTVEIKNERNRTSFDIDELSDSDDLTIRTLDQRGNVFDEALGVQWRVTIDPTDPALPTYTTDWATLAADTDGTYAIPGLTDTTYKVNGVDTPLPAGTYTYDARRPNGANGQGLTNATPVTVSASESEIVFDEGATANVTVETSTTITGKLGLADGTGLGGREVTLTYTPGVDSRLAPTAEQPTGVTVTGNTAVLTTAADGTFAIKVTDPAGPAVVPDAPENSTLLATATDEVLNGNNTLLKEDLGPNEVGTAPNAAGVRNAEALLNVNFVVRPAVADIVITADNLFGGAAAPGKPVDLDILVKDAQGNNLQDFPVEISVDKGFLSPNAEDEDDLTLAADQDDAGDLFGFYQNDGTSKTVSTGDASVAGAVVAMAKDVDFDDDGLATLTVTVKAGDRTETQTITFDASNYLNLAEVSLERAAGEPTGDVNVGDELDFQLYAEDQFGNLVGGILANISDDSTIADVRTDGDFGQTQTDFSVSGAGITATSDAPAVQRLIARINGTQTLVGADGNDATSARTVLEQSDAINWVAGGPTGPVPIVASLTGNNNGGKADRLFVETGPAADGATVRLFRVKKNGDRVRVGVKSLNDAGAATFRVADRNGRRFTKYVAVVRPTADTLGDTSNTKRVR